MALPLLKEQTEYTLSDLALQWASDHECELRRRSKVIPITSASKASANLLEAETSPVRSVLENIDASYWYAGSYPFSVSIGMIPLSDAFFPCYSHSLDSGFYYDATAFNKFATSLPFYSIQQAPHREISLKNKAAIALLQSWLDDESSEAEDAKGLAETKRLLNSARSSGRNLFD